MRPADRGYLQTLRCEAPLSELWHALVLPEGLRLWHAEEAWVDARPGGSYRYRSRLFGMREAHIDVIEPGRRLRLVYDPNPDWPPAGDSVIVEDFLLDTRGTGTARIQSQLRILGSGVPAAPEWRATHRRLQAGWAVAFSYLQRCLDARQLERLAS
jgi:uncharacterized protein YndB with AHSA1/START domain